MSAERWPLWIRAESQDAAAAQGEAWANAEKALRFVRIVSVEPHPEFSEVWTVTVEAETLLGPAGTRDAPTLWESA